MQMPNENGLFGYLAAQLSLPSGPSTIEARESSGVMEIWLRGDRLIVITRHKDAASRDFIDGICSLALCLISDMYWWPYFLNQIGLILRSDFELGWVFLFTFIIPCLFHFVCLLLQVWICKRQVTWWRFWLLMYAFLNARTWWMGFVMP